MTTPPASAVDLPDAGIASTYAAGLLRDLGIDVTLRAGTAHAHPAQRWAESGLMALTGSADGEPECCPVPLPDCADGTLLALRALTGAPLLREADGARLLTERAATAGLTRNGDRSTQGHCRLLATRDGTIAVNLARDDDRSLLPALLGSDGNYHWSNLPDELRNHRSEELVTQGRQLGLALADATLTPTAVEPWFIRTHSNPLRSAGRRSPPLVVDLSSLWAGPLCSHLLERAGARVIKVESRQRPDGGRIGSPAFFQLLNQGKEMLSLDFHAATDRQTLSRWLEQADIVIEASRPRALRQLGFVAEDFLDRRPGKTWISITGHGRPEPQGNWIAYGDDAGVAAGLSALLHQVTGQWLICGDAIADPLTGLHAALAAWACWRSGTGGLIDLSLAATVRHCVAATAPADGNYRRRHRQWRRYLTQHAIKAQPPRSMDH